MATLAFLEKVKTACRVTSNAYDTELTDLISAGLADIGITDVKASALADADSLDSLVQRAVITYCKMNFGYLATDQYQKFKASYDEQKAQLLMSSKYTEWGDPSA